jgi:pyruvate dehydrogenase E2 component (dihydrolipoamide acetyltransferase)
VAANTDVNVGIAVAIEDGLVVPVVHGTDRLPLAELAERRGALVAAAREGRLRPEDVSGGTFTVSNLGMYGINEFTAVINPPQAAILAVGALEPKPVVRDGEVQVRSRMTLTLSCDHRILYGADAAEFLGRIRERLEQPLLLAL